MSESPSAGNGGPGCWRTENDCEAKIRALNLGRSDQIEWSEGSRYDCSGTRYVREQCNGPQQDGEGGEERLDGESWVIWGLE